MKQLGLRACLLGVILATLSAPVRSVGEPLGQTRAKDSYELKQILSLEEFRSIFNRDTGAPRLILLLSPI